jgi:very-short-patch-repair endonuclease/endogenous inhibitor of DNA gyrase (YacG/DUF329 family)
MGKNQYKLRKLNCPSCGKIVEGNFSKTRIYCSRKCYDTSRPTAVKNPLTKKMCEMCNIEYETKNTEQRFCNTDCQNEWQSRNKSKFICKTCGTGFGLSKSLADSRDYEIKFCSMKCRNLDPEWRKSNILANIVQQNNKGLNKLEVAGSKILNELGIEFEEQFLVFDKFLVDVFIPDKNIVIQWDGDYWHGHPTTLKDGIPDKRQKRRMDFDKSQDAYMIKAGYTILRYWEHDVIKNKKYVYENIKHAVQ